MPGQKHTNAPAGTRCCFICHRYLEPEKLDGGRCRKRLGCHRAAARMIGRPPLLSKKARRALGMP